MKSIKAIFRRGHQQTPSISRIEGSHGESAISEGGLHRSSSVNNLHVNTKTAIWDSSKSRKSSSRDKIDPLLGHGTSNAPIDKKADRKDSFDQLRNNNKSISDDRIITLEESLQEIETLRIQLHEMSSEKSRLALELGERKGQIIVLQNQIDTLKMYQEQSSSQLEQLSEENISLRNRLRDVADSPLSDNEKQQLLLYESHQQRQHNSDLASITPLLEDDVIDATNGSLTMDWDKHSSSNVSEVSVACLQDKINQMQETHYSTNEELQATLQELTDLQQQLVELQQENERLSEDKNLMFDSLCRQTERLKDSRQENESLKQLIYRNREEADKGSSNDEKHKNELQDLKETNNLQSEQIRQLIERNNTLESNLDAKHAEYKLLEQELVVAKDQCASRQIEIDRLKDYLDTTKAKILELDQELALSDKTELEKLLELARKEKESLESEITYLKDQLTRTKNEVEKLQEQTKILQDECKILRSKAKMTQSDLEFKCEKLAAEKAALTEQVLRLEATLKDLEIRSQCQTEDKRQLSVILAETQRNLTDSERKVLSFENELAELKKRRQQEIEDWEKFQNDLLTSVRVANDFRNEAHLELQRLDMENKTNLEKIRQLESKLDQMKVSSNDSVPLRPCSFPGDDLGSCRRQTIGLTRQNSRQSVRSLIESIENAGKPVTKSSIETETSALSGNPPRTPEWNEAVPNIGLSLSAKPTLKEEQPNKPMTDWNKTYTSDSLGKGCDVKNKTEDNRENIIQKNIAFSRRNSYSDANERKEDPLNMLVRNGGSKRNALLKWCQIKTKGYRNIDITNFSTSWTDGLALCALLHTYLPHLIPYDSLTPQEKRRNFALAFEASESVGIPTTLNITDMIQFERPDWQQVMAYVTAIYLHFET